MRVRVTRIDDRPQYLAFPSEEAAGIEEGNEPFVKARYAAGRGYVELSGIAEITYINLPSDHVYAEIKAGEYTVILDVHPDELLHLIGGRRKQ